MIIIEPTYSWAYGPTYRKKTELIILHHAAAPSATPEDIHRWHLAQGWRGIAYHFYVRKDGSVYRGRGESEQGGHTLDYNASSIGVCFEGNFENETMGAAQLRAGRELLKYLADKYSDLPVKTHGELNATACPGRNFPLKELTQGGGEDPKPIPTDNDWGREMSHYLSELAELPGSDWSDKERRWAIENGVFIGNDAGWMSWKSFVTREELAIVISRLARLLENNR